MKFLYFKNKNSIVDKIPTILEIINEAIEVSKFSNTENTLTIYYSYSNIAISDLVSILVAELFEDIIVYESLTYPNFKKAEEALKDVSYILDNNYIPNNYINNKTILLNLKEFDNRVANLVLNNYYNDKDMLHTIKTFLEENQNVTTASKELYLHRNTLNQRLNKFEESTGFNVKKFIDGYLIYHLLK